jgi:hypothetical protein
MSKRRKTCPVCHKRFTPARSDAVTCSSACRQRAYRNRNNPRRWQVLPPEGKGECDYDPELEPAFDNYTEAEQRRNAADFQAREAIRLAEEYALLRQGTQPGEIKPAVIKEVRQAINAWRGLLAELKRRRV